MVTLSIQTKKVNDIREFVWELDRIRAYQVYFQKLKDGNFIARVITNLTNEKWLENEIKAGRIYLPLDIMLAESN